MTEIERCPKCNKVIALVGRAHNCRPRPDAVSTSSPTPPPKPKFGDAVSVPLSEMPARGIGPKSVDPFVEEELRSSRAKKLRAKREPLAAQGAGPAPAKRAKPGTATYTGQYRDPEKRRASQRALMKKRRAKEPA